MQMNKQIVVIMSNDPQELKKEAINTVYKYEHLGVKVLTTVSLASMIISSKSWYSMWQESFNLDPNNRFSSHVDRSIIRLGSSRNPCDEHDYHIVELDVPEKHLDNVVKEMKAEPFILKVDGQLSNAGQLKKERNKPNESSEPTIPSIFDF